MSNQQWDDSSLILYTQQWNTWPENTIDEAGRDSQPMLTVIPNTKYPTIIEIEAEQRFSIVAKDSFFALGNLFHLGKKMTL